MTGTVLSPTGSDVGFATLKPTRWKMKFKAVFFDWDLTLANSVKVNYIAYKAVCKEVGAKPNKNEFRRFVGSSVTKNVEYFSKKYNYKNDLRETLKGAFIRYIDRIKVYDKKITNELKKKGLKIAIITGNAEEVVSKIARKNKMKFDMIIGDEHMRGRGKIWAINHLLKKFKLKKKEVVYIGDHINDIKQAHKAGIKSMIIPSAMYKKSYLKKFHPEFICKNMKCVRKEVA